MKNVLLFISAFILLVIFGSISLVVAIEKIIRGKASDSYFFECALAIDVLGCTMGQHLWNAIFITDEGYQFGRRGETMSSVLGKNQVKCTLKPTGKMLVLILDKFQPNHCLISIIP